MPRALDAPRWSHVQAAGTRVPYLDIGDGDPLVFLHGWGLTPRTYAPALERLAGAGVRILAPVLPGFGGTRPPRRDMSMPGYASAVSAFVEAIGPDRPVFLMGHSFGGGVALRLAFDRPDLVRSLTLLNSVGGSPSRRRGSNAVDDAITSRPWWQWAVGAAAEVDPRSFMRMRPADVANVVHGLVRDYVPNTVRGPLTMARTALLSLGCDLAEEAHELVASGMPVLFVWGDRDRLTLPGAFAAVRSSLPAEVVQGRHGWLLFSPEEFGGLLRDALVVHAMLERKQRKMRAAGPQDRAVPPERRRRGRVNVLGTGGAS